jgi:hypothetical protein
MNASVLAPRPMLKRLYWQLTALLLAAHFAGWAHGLAAVTALNTLQVLHFALMHRGIAAFEVQLRIGYLALLGLGSIGPLWPVHLVQFVGVNALLVADYCLLARLLVLLPWNRSVPLTPAMTWWLFTTAPAPGSVRDRLAALVQAQGAHGRAY